MSSKPKHAVTVVGKDVPPDEPLFLLRGQDVLAPGIVDAYAAALEAYAAELPPNQIELNDRLVLQAGDVRAVGMRFRQWQLENKARVKVPD